MAFAGAAALVIEPLLPERWQEWIDARQSDLADSDGPAINIARDARNRIERIVDAVPSPILRPTPALQTEDTPSKTSLNLQTAGSTTESNKEYLVLLINQDRAAAGLTAVTFGANTAAQDHAEEMLERSYLSHWGMNGLKPYMRYRLAGGTGYEAENVSGIDSPLKEGALYTRISVQTELAATQNGFMTSPGHRENILNPWHQMVNLGIACNQYTCAVVQQFESNYVEFDREPAFVSGRLAVSGRTLSPFTFHSLGVWYERSPHPLSLGQLDVTYCYSVGDIPAAVVRPPLPLNSYYPDDSAYYEWEACEDPYLADAQSPRAPDPLPASTTVRSTTVPLVTADEWEVEERDFTVEADLSQVLSNNGSGVYTVLVWGEAEGDPVIISKYPIFVD